MSLALTDVPTTTRDRSALNSHSVPRRLCMIVHGPYPPDTRVARAVRVALDEGWQVDVLATRQPGEQAKQLVDGATVIRLPIEHRWGASALEVVREYVSFTVVASVAAARLTARRRYAAVHVNNPPDFLVAAAAVPRLAGARVIFDVHDLSPDMFEMRFGGRRGAKLGHHILRLVERAATRFADVVLTVHEPYRRELAARGVAPEKIVIVMNTVDERRLPRPETASRGEDFRVVYQGTVTPPYGVDMLVEAVARIADEAPDLKLEIYGVGDSLPDLRALVGTLGLGERVWLSGAFLPHAEVLAKIQSASVGVIPNLPTPLSRFALSTKLFEYVALCIPVVCADLPTMREYFSDDEVLFFEAGNVEALALALTDIRQNPERAQLRVGAAVRRYEQYRWETNAKRYAAVLAGCANR
jgi:glycosyltransferase involved in cell wall biosynthesis